MKTMISITMHNKFPRPQTPKVDKVHNKRTIRNEYEDCSKWRRKTKLAEMILMPKLDRCTRDHHKYRHSLRTTPPSKEAGARIGAEGSEIDQCQRICRTFQDLHRRWDQEATQHPLEEFLKHKDIRIRCRVI